MLFSPKEFVAKQWRIAGSNIYWIPSHSCSNKYTLELGENSSPLIFSQKLSKEISLKKYQETVCSFFNQLRQKKYKNWKDVKN